MKTRNEQPSFKQKADSKGQNRADSRLDNCKDSRGMKGDMCSESRLDNCTKKNQSLVRIEFAKENKIELQT